MRVRRTEHLVGLAIFLAHATASAQDRLEPDAPAEAARAPEDLRRQAGEAFQRGTRLVGEAKWAEALASFEEAQALVPHAITLFNIGACERALGRYVSARATLGAALALHARGTKTLPATLVEDAQAFRREIGGLLARVSIDVQPAGASLAVDGRPLSTGPAVPSAPPLLVAGVRPPGKGEPLPARRVVLELDPGRHLLTFSRQGASDSLVVRDFRSGDNPPLALSLADLPATIEISADRQDAIVTVDGKDLGPVPVSLMRPAGAYRVTVEREGFQSAEALLRVAAGQQTTYRAELPVEEPSVLERWWFWTIAATAVTGAVVGTYFATRSEPEPQRASAGGGSLGLKIPIP
jgi:hypothetical protein